MLFFLIQDLSYINSVFLSMKDVNDNAELHHPCSSSTLLLMLRLTSSSHDPDFSSIFFFGRSATGVLPKPVAVWWWRLHPTYLEMWRRWRLLGRIGWTGLCWSVWKHCRVFCLLYQNLSSICNSHCNHSSSCCFSCVLQASPNARGASSRAWAP